MSHMGEGNWRARPRRPAGAADQAPAGHRRARRSADVPLPVPARAGDAGHARVARRRAVPAAWCARARSSTPTSCPRSRCRTGIFRPDSGVRGCMDAWLRLGGPHHQVLNPGRHGGRVAHVLRAGGHRVRAGLTEGAVMTRRSDAHVAPARPSPVTALSPRRRARGAAAPTAPPPRPRCRSRRSPSARCQAARAVDRYTLSQRAA